MDNSGITPSWKTDSVIVAKVERQPGKPEFYEVLAAGPVNFDPRPGWVLLSTPIGARPRRQTLAWMHPADVPFAWIRPFRFAAPDALSSAA